jgi:periplasmic protein TonB
MYASAATRGLIRPLRQERVLLWCVLASIALHALVLLGLSRRDAPAPPAKTPLVLTASRAPVATAPHETLPPSQPVPPPAKAAPAPRPELNRPAAAPAHAAQKPAPIEAPKTAPPEPAPAPPGAAAPSAQPVAPGQASAAPPAPAGVTTEAGARSGSEADAGTLEQYRLALIVATRRYKRYPAIAMEKGWQGRVDVHMVIGANGMIASATVKTSSGHEILDNQALDMLKKGKTTVPIPASLRGREFLIDVPVIFNLDNPNS